MYINHVSLSLSVLTIYIFFTYSLLPTSSLLNSTSILACQVSISKDHGVKRWPLCIGTMGSCIMNRWWLFEVFSVQLGIMSMFGIIHQVQRQIVGQLTHVDPDRIGELDFSSLGWNDVSSDPRPWDYPMPKLAQLERKRECVIENKIHALVDRPSLMVKGNQI